MKKPSLEIVIVTFNGERWIEDCIRSIRENAYKGCEIIVVDNNSRDETVPILKKYFSEVTILQQTRNMGFGQGANIGIQCAMSRKADYILILNQDLKLEKNCLRNLIAVCERNRSIGIASPLQLNYDGTTLDPKFRELHRFESDRPDECEALRDSIEVDTIIGASMLFRTEVLQAIGTFDPLYFLYHEEGDLCRRARYHGFQIHIVPSAKILHQHIQLSAEGMSLHAKFSATYGYFIYLLKDPFFSLPRNFRNTIRQMRDWTFRDLRPRKLIVRSLVIAAVAAFIIMRLHRILANRKSEMQPVKLLHADGKKALHESR